MIPQASRPVAALCVHADGIYRRPGVEVYCAKRDARNYGGPFSIVAHPPCRLFGRLKHFAKSSDPISERALGVFCAQAIRQFGGVLEHPAGSELWMDAGLPLPGDRDQFGGFTMALPQFWFGHRGIKDTWFYFRGIEPANLPQLPFRLLSDDFVPVEDMGKREREATPPVLADWLLEVARRCVV